MGRLDLGGQGDPVVLVGRADLVAREGLAYLPVPEALAGPVVLVVLAVRYRLEGLQQTLLVHLKVR